jgi:hypothetical protein
MDISTLVTAVLSSSALSISAATWLTKSLIGNRLTKDLKDYQARIDGQLVREKAETDGRISQQLKDYQSGIDERLNASKVELQARVDAAQAETDAALRKGVEDYLGERDAERQYQLEAKKRLYTAIGPLRFQLIKACVEFAARVDRIGVGKQPYATSLTGYFGRSTIFRLLRLFGILELIERQIAYADFSVDPSTVGLLRFKQQSFLCLASSTIALDHPKANWVDEREHVFFDTLSMIGTTMIVEGTGSNAPRVMRFDEFNNFIDDKKNLARLDPIPTLFEDFSVDAKPILWTRLVALGHLCTFLVVSEGERAGIPADPFDGPKLLLASKDEYLNANHERYCEMLKSVEAKIAAKV